MQPDRILKFSNLIAVGASTNATTARAIITLPARKVIGISVSALAHIVFSNNATVADATNSIVLPGAGVYVFDTGNWTSLSIFSGAAAVISSVFEAGN